MSHTVIMSEAERERRTENRINAAVRHCRIGKVRIKEIYPRAPFDYQPHEIGTPFVWRPNAANPAPIEWWQNPVVSTCATGHTH